MHFGSTSIDWSGANQIRNSNRPKTKQPKTKIKGQVLLAFDFSNFFIVRHLFKIKVFSHVPECILRLVYSNSVHFIAIIVWCTHFDLSTVVPNCLLAFCTYRNTSSSSAAAATSGLLLKIKLQTVTVYMLQCYN